MALASWNPADKNAAIALSPDNLTATATAIGWKSVRSTVSKSAGKWYFEVKLTAFVDSTFVVGLLNASASLNDSIGNAPGEYGWGYPASLRSNNTASPMGTSPAANDVVMVALDLDAGNIWFGKNGSWFGGGDPATGVSPSFSGISVASYYPALSLYTTGNGAVLALGQTDYAAPTGFSLLGPSGNGMAGGTGGASAQGMAVAVTTGTARGNSSAGGAGEAIQVSSGAAGGNGGASALMPVSAGSSAGSGGAFAEGITASIGNGHAGGSGSAQAYTFTPILMPEIQASATRPSAAIISLPKLLAKATRLPWATITLPKILASARRVPNAVVSLPRIAIKASRVTVNVVIALPRLGVARITNAVITLPRIGIAHVANAVITLPKLLAFANRPGTAGNAQAWVTNLATGETTRWLGIGFTRIARIGGKTYGLKADGLYEIGGTDDNGTPINCTLKTNPHDFGNMFLKRSPYVYVGSLTDVQVTAYAERDTTVTVGPFASGPGQKRVTLARGPIARYWAYQVRNVNGNQLKIDGLEPVIELTTRKA